MPSPITIFFVSALSKQILDDFSFEPLKGIFISDKIDWIEPSSPKDPCNAINIKSWSINLSWISIIEFWFRIYWDVLWPNWIHASKTASPVLIETKRSSELPPDITPILILYPLLLPINLLKLNLRYRSIWLVLCNHYPYQSTRK